jgi:nucleoside-diphosphate-sugar epimerase
MIVLSCNAARAHTEPLPDQPGHVPIKWANIGKAKRLLGIHRTSMEQGLRDFVDWYRSTLTDAGKQ